LQREVPRALLGRVIGLQWFVAIGLAPVSFAVAGPLGRVFGARPVRVVIGLVASLIVGAVMFIRGARTPEQVGREHRAAALVSS
jgi:DHA3 family tetracycline resistance protein-like MFS transporter